MFLDINENSILIEDAIMYWTQTSDILKYGAFVTSHDGVLTPITERVPLYYLMLGTIRYIFGDDLLFILIIEGTIDSVTCLLIAIIGSMYSRNVGYISGLLAALSPNLIINSASILTDSLFLFLFTLMLFFFLSFIRTSNVRYLIYSGLLLGCAIMTRTVAQFLPVFLSIVVFIIVKNKMGNNLIAFLLSFLFLLTSIMPIAPIIYRNYTEFNTLQLTSQNGGHIAGWVIPLVRQKYDQTPHEKGARDAFKSIEDSYNSENSIELRELSSFGKSKVYTEEGIKLLLEYPLSSISSAWLEGIFINIASPALVIDQRIRGLSTLSYYSIEGKNILHRVTKYLINNSYLYTSIILCMLVLLPIILLFKFYGFINLFRLYPWIAILTFFYMLYFLLINGPVASPKYRLPIEPALIILTAIGLVDFYERRKEMGNKLLFWRKSKLNL